MNEKTDSLAVLSKRDIDQQIAIARQYPRSINDFRNEVKQLVTLNEQVAGECVYSIPRSGKVIEGPSARFAEIVINCWGNCRSGARIIDDTGDYIVAQGVFHDLQKNSMITIEVERRITDKKGRRYNADMISVTGNAASSIALRNAALKGVPKAFWADLYEDARRVIMGDIKTLANRRAEMFAYLNRYGVTEDIALKFLSRKGVEDVDLEDMVKLRGLASSLKNGETSVETIVREMETEPDNPKAGSKAPPKKKQTAKETPPESEEKEKLALADQGMIDMLKQTADDAGIMEKDILEQAGVSDFDKITFNQVNDLLEWIQGVHNHE